MSHKHDAILAKIFAHPIAANIDWKKLTHALEHYGATVDMSHHGRAKIVMNGNELVIHSPHHGHDIENKDDIIALRHFLTELGVTPEPA